MRRGLGDAILLPESCPIGKEKDGSCFQADAYNSKC